MLLQIDDCLINLWCQLHQPCLNKENNTCKQEPSSWIKLLLPINGSDSFIKLFPINKINSEIRTKQHFGKYEGRSINKLQNDIILLIFKIWKFKNIRFVGNLIGDIYWNFYDDDVISVMSLVLRTQSVGAVFCPAVSFATRKCWRALWVARKVNKFNKQACLNIRH